MNQNKGGESLVTLGMLVWLMVSVGPWWIGVLLLALGTLLNVAAARRPRR